MMRNLKHHSRLIAAVLALATLSAAAIEPLGFDDPAKQARYDALLQQLRCVVCQNQSLASSDADLAGDLRRRVHRMIAEGHSKEQITSHLTDRYGDFVLYNPPMTARTYALWFGPPALAVAGMIALAVTVRRRSRTRPAGLDPSDRARLREVLDRNREGTP